MSPREGNEGGQNRPSKTDHTGRRRLRSDPWPDSAPREVVQCRFRSVQNDSPPRCFAPVSRLLQLSVRVHVRSQAGPTRVEDVRRDATGSEPLP